MSCSSCPCKSLNKRLIFPVILLFFTLITITACAKTPPSTSNPTSADVHKKALRHNTSEKTLDNPKKFRGLFTYGHEVRSFTLCGESKELWVIDKTQGDVATVSRDMTSQSYQPFFVEVEGWLTSAPLNGFGADYSRAIVFEKLIHTSRVEESWGCREKYDQFIFKAQGSEPGWTVIVSKEGIKFSSINHEGPIDFPLVAPVATEHATTYESSSNKHTLRMTIMADKCFDTMSGERFGWEVEVSLDGKAYYGCAKQGDQLP